MFLVTYAKKRNFKNTPEPKESQKLSVRQAQDKKVKNQKLIFVVQKHNASRLHFDFRLEMEGVLKSWAVPKGPSMDPDIKRLAIMTEDHPYEYKDFEGVIPKGNYGAGIVEIWDKGTYENGSEKNLLDGLGKGHISFILHGQKLNGKFNLFKLKSGENQWILAKSKESFAFSLPNQVSTMPHKVKPMLATLTDKPFDNEDFIFEIKWDGYRAIAELDKDNVFLYSRNYLNFNEIFVPIVDSLRKINREMILDGEVVSLDEKGRAKFQLLQHYIKTKKGNLLYYVFDILHLDGQDLSKLPLIERKKILKMIIPQTLPYIKISDYIEKNGIDFFNLALKQGLEGIIAKDKRSLYKQGVRSTEWVKIKARLQQEAIVGGFTKGRGARKYFGALVLGVHDPAFANKLRYIGHSGGGFDDQMLAEIYSKLKPLIIKDSPFADFPRSNEGITWVKPVLVCEIAFSEWTDEGFMRQPIFLGLRVDKDPKDVKKELPKNHPLSDSSEPSGNTSLNDKGLSVNTATAPADTRSKETVKSSFRDDSSFGLKLTNLNKVYFPEDNFTKGDVVNYYIKIAKYILPYLKDRPQSLHRMPDGIYGERFYQKDTHVAQGGIRTFSIYSESENKNVNYIIGDTEKTLIYMVNLGCIELNPWLSRFQNLNKPDFMVIDLDPVEIDFSEVIKAAHTVHEILNFAKVNSFLKTSGKTGLHILIPLRAVYDFDQIKQFGEIIARITFGKLPEITSIKRMPEKRSGKVYVDYLQNRIGQTITPPYSIRPIKGVLVSTPLKWEELSEKIKPSDYNIKNIFQRLKRIGDFIHPILEEETDILKAIDRLSKFL